MQLLINTLNGGDRGQIKRDLFGLTNIILY